MKLASALAMLACLYPCSVWAQQPEGIDRRPTITVDGEAAVQVQPNQIVVSLGVETRDADMHAAQQANTDAIKKVLAAIRAMGVSERDIQTDTISLSVERRYRADLGREEAMGYLARNALAVTLAEAGRTTELVARALQAGANAIYGIQYRTTELRKYRDQARELALKAAKEKAEAMAGVLGQSIGDPLRISENERNLLTAYYSSGRSDPSTTNVIQMVEGGSSETGEALALGKLSIRAKVNVVFEMKQAPAPQKLAK